MTDGTSWFAVRSFVAIENDDEPRWTYEERVTLWRAATFEDAFAKASDDANEYASQWGPGDPLASVPELMQAHRLFDEPGEGVEVFSLVRDSELAPDAYLARHFDTGSERQGSDE